MLNTNLTTRMFAGVHTAEKGRLDHTKEEDALSEPRDGVLLGSFNLSWDESGSMGVDLNRHFREPELNWKSSTDDTAGLEAARELFEKSWGGSDHVPMFITIDNEAPPMELPPGVEAFTMEFPPGVPGNHEVSVYTNLKSIPMLPEALSDQLTDPKPQGEPCRAIHDNSGGRPIRR